MSRSYLLFYSSSFIYFLEIDIDLVVVFFSFPEKPKVTLHARVQSGLCVKKGEEIQIQAYISGSPYPKVAWLRNDEDVTKEPTKKIVPVVKKKKKTKVCVRLEVSERS